MASYIIKKGYASVKEDGLRSFLWSKRWLVLREQTLTIQRNEVNGYIIALLFKIIYFIVINYIKLNKIYIYI